MGILRDREAPAEVWRRFRPVIDTFTSARDGGAWMTRVGATAERSLELFHDLTAELTDPVRFSMTRLCDGASWHGEQLALADVREAVARLRVPLAVTGGVEVSVFTSDDQLSVSPQLVLHCFGTTDRWRPLLVARELREQRAIPDRRWARSREDFAVSPALDVVLDSIAATLNLARHEAGPPSGA